VAWIRIAWRSGEVTANSTQPVRKVVGNPKQLGPVRDGDEIRVEVVYIL
jgi:hypothetical protein